MRTNLYCMTSPHMSVCLSVHVDLLLSDFLTLLTVEQVSYINLLHNNKAVYTCTPLKLFASNNCQSRVNARSLFGEVHYSYMYEYLVTVTTFMCVCFVFQKYTIW